MRYSPWRHWSAALLRHRPIQLTFFVTRRCNARCPFCFYLNGSGGELPAGGEFSLEEVRAAAPSLGKLLWLAFSGGEPYLRQDLVQLSRAFYEANCPAILLYSTNGFAPERIAEATEEIAARCRRSTVVVKVSLDGVGEAHDRLRGVPGGFEKALRTYRLLARLAARYANLELGVNTVLQRDNQEQIGAIVDFVRALPHLRAHTVSLVRGRPREAGCLEVLPERYREAAARLEAEPRTYRFFGARLKAAQDLVQRRLIYATMIERKRQIPCYAGRLNLVLAENGALYPCEMLGSTLGNLREHGYDVRRVVASERARALLEQIAAGRCYCTHECYFITNILFNPRLYPALARELWRLVRAQLRGAARARLPR